MTTTEHFEALDQQQQVERLELLGRSALQSFNVEPKSMLPLEHAENTTFKVDTADGGYCLRIHRPGYQTFESIHSELEWLTALRTDTDLLVPDPQRSRLGELVVRIRDAAVPEERNCVLFRWLEGEFCRTGVTSDHFTQLGKVTAQLHEHALHWARPVGFSRHALDDTDVYAPSSDGILENPSQLISDEGRARVQAIADESRALMRRLGKGPDVYGLIHGDLHRGNFLFEGGQIKLIDFDDCGFGHYLYDFAASLAFQVNSPEFEGLRDGLFSGYESVRPLPPETLECLPAFLRLRFHGLIKWFLSRSDNPKLRERAAHYIENFLLGIDRSRAMDS